MSIFKHPKRKLPVQRHWTVQQSDVTDKNGLLIVDPDRRNHGATPEIKAPPLTLYADDNKQPVTGAGGGSQGSVLPHPDPDNCFCFSISFQRAKNKGAYRAHCHVRVIRPQWLKHECNSWVVSCCVVLCWQGGKQQWWQWPQNSDQ